MVLSVLLNVFVRSKQIFPVTYAIVSALCSSLKHFRKKSQTAAQISVLIFHRHSVSIYACKSATDKYSALFSYNELILEHCTVAVNPLYIIFFCFISIMDIMADTSSA